MPRQRRVLSRHNSHFPYPADSSNHSRVHSFWSILGKLFWAILAHFLILWPHQIIIIFMICKKCIKKSKKSIEIPPLILRYLFWGKETLWDIPTMPCSGLNRLPAKSLEQGWPSLNWHEKQWPICNITVTPYQRLQESCRIRPISTQTSPGGFGNPIIFVPKGRNDSALRKPKSWSTKGG